MKFKEKLARNYAFKECIEIENKTTAEGVILELTPSIELIFLAGFEKARELAVDLIENASYQRALRDMPKLGEEEIE